LDAELYCHIISKLLDDDLNQKSMNLCKNVADSENSLLSPVQTPENHLFLWADVAVHF
jgi:hypothetical protein